MTSGIDTASETTIGIFLDGWFNFADIGHFNFWEAVIFHVEWFPEYQRMDCMPEQLVLLGVIPRLWDCGWRLFSTTKVLKRHKWKRASGTYTLDWLCISRLLKCLWIFPEYKSVGFCQVFSDGLSFSVCFFVPVTRNSLWWSCHF